MSEDHEIIICSKAEEAYLIDALMVFMHAVQPQWQDDQYRELEVLMEKLLRPRKEER